MSDSSRKTLDMKWMEKEVAGGRDHWGPEAQRCQQFEGRTEPSCPECPPHLPELAREWLPDEARCHSGHATPSISGIRYMRLAKT